MGALGVVERDLGVVVFQSGIPRIVLTSESSPTDLQFAVSGHVGFVFTDRFSLSDPRYWT